MLPALPITIYYRDSTSYPAPNLASRGAECHQMDRPWRRSLPANLAVLLVYCCAVSFSKPHVKPSNTQHQPHRPRWTPIRPKVN